MILNYGSIASGHGALAFGNNGLLANLIDSLSGEYSSIAAFEINGNTLNDLFGNKKIKKILTKEGKITYETLV